MEPSSKQYDLDEVLAHAGWVRALARQLLADEHRAEDAAQEAMRVALERRPRSGPGLKAWLGRVVRNVAFNQRREEARRFQREQRVAGAQEQRRHDPESRDLSAWAEQMQAIVAAVEGLEEPFRQTLKLRYFEELSPTEIAQHLGVPAATVRTRLKRGLERLRVQLRATWGEDRYLGCLIAVLPRIHTLNQAGAAQIAFGRRAVVKIAASVAAIGALFIWSPWRSNEPEPTTFIESQTASAEPAAFTAASLGGLEAPERELVSTQASGAAEGSEAWVIQVINGATSEPVSGANVFLMPPRSADHPDWESIYAISETHFAVGAEEVGERYTANDLGMVHLDSQVEAGRIVFAGAPDLWGETRLDPDQAAGKATVITLFADYNLSVRLLDPRGQAVSGVAVGLCMESLPGEDRARAQVTIRSDAHGVAKFPHLGEFVRRVARSGVLATPRVRVQAPLRVPIATDVELRPGRLEELSITLPDHGRVEVTVLDPDGQPVANGTLVELQRQRTPESSRNDDPSIMPGEFFAEEWRGVIVAPVRDGVAVFDYVGLDCPLEAGVGSKSSESVWAHRFDGPKQAGAVVRTTIQQDRWKLPIRAQLLDESGLAWQGQTRAIFLLQDERNRLRQINLDHFDLDQDGTLISSAPQLRAGEAISGRVWIWSEGDGWARHWVSEWVDRVPMDQLDLGTIRLNQRPVLAGAVATVEGMSDFEVEFDLRSIPRFPIDEDEPRENVVDQYLESRVNVATRAGQRFEVYFPPEYLEARMHLGAHAKDQSLGLKTTGLLVNRGDQEVLIELTRDAEFRGRLLLDPGFAERLSLSRQAPTIDPQGNVVGSAETAEPPDAEGWFRCTLPGPECELLVLDRASEMILHRVALPALADGQVIELPTIDLRGRLFERRVTVIDSEGRLVEAFSLARFPRAGFRETVSMAAPAISNPGTFLAASPAIDLVVAAPGCRVKRCTIADPETEIQLDAGFPVLLHAPLDLPELPEGASLEIGLSWKEVDVEGLPVGMGRFRASASLGELARLPGLGRWQARLQMRIRRADMRTSASIGTTDFVLHDLGEVTEVTVGYDPEALARILAWLEGE